MAGGAPSSRAPVQAPPEQAQNGAAPSGQEPKAPTPVEAEAPALRFRQSPIRLHPGETRQTSLVIDPRRLSPGAQIGLAADPGLWVKARSDRVPTPGARGLSSVRLDLRARVTVEPGSRLAVLAEAGEHTAELEVVIVRHHASGWVREIARKDEDAVIEAQFDPESGVVTVYEGRREFKALERSARRGGIPKRRVREYLPYRMLEVEVAANAVYAWAAGRIVEGRLPGERPSDPADYAHAVHAEAQALRHRFHERLMRAFLEPEVFEGRVRAEPEESARGTARAQQSLPGG